MSEHPEMEHTDEIDVRAERARRCYTCNGWNPVSGVRTRETVGMVCPTCGWDYGSDGEPPRVMYLRRGAAVSRVYMLASVLAEHIQRHGIRDMRVHCSCGWASDKREGMPSHRAHVAAALNAALAAQEGEQP